MKRHYVKLINNEFRELQLAPELKHKLLFDLIDYCVLLSERVEAHELDQLQLFIRGFLVFHYFINTFIRVHFMGFDQFIESNHSDFIIYLNVFAYYDDPQMFVLEWGKISLQTIKQYILEYLMEKNVLTFDIEEFYSWMYDYIDYVKEKDREASVGDIDKFSYEESDNDSFEERFPKLTLEDAKVVTAFSDSYHPTSTTNTPTLKLASDTSLPTNRIQSSVHKSQDTLTPYPQAERLDENPIHPNREPTRKGYHPTRSMSGKNFSSPAPPPHRVPYERRKAPPPDPPSNASSTSSTSNTSHDYLKAQHTTRPPIPQSTPVTNRQQGYHPFGNSSASLSNGTTNGHSSYKQSPRQAHAQIDTTPTRSIPTKEQQPAAMHGYPSRPPQGYAHPVSQGYHPGPPQVFTGPSQGYHPGPPQGFLPGPPQGYHQSHPHYQPNGYYAPAPPQGYPQGSPHEMNQASQPSGLFTTRYDVCGLRNLGTTCYLNSTVQLLFGVDDMRRLLLGDIYNYIRKPKMLQQLENRNFNKDVILLVDASRSLWLTFKKHGGQVITPSKFVRVVSILKPDFNLPNDQQDAQEFLLFVLDRLHEELSDTTKLGDHNYERILREYVRQWDIHIPERDMKGYLVWYRQLLEHEGTSPIHDIVQGQVQHKLVCGQCGFELTLYSPFTILSLAIPTNKPVVNLLECLQMFTSDEVLSGDNAWNCPKCCDEPHVNPLDSHPVFTPKKLGIFKLGRRPKLPNKDPKKLKIKKNAISTKMLTFVKFPKVLFIHLSRFLMFSMTDKLDTAIDFPLILAFLPTINYKLCGIINHYGNLKLGHYTAVVNKLTYHQQEHSTRENIDHPYWCNFDDSMFHENIPFGANPNFSQTLRDVYVLVYERI